MDPVSVALAAQGVMKLGSSIYSLFAASSNSDEAKKRQQKKYEQGQAQIAQERAQLADNKLNTELAITSSAQTASASSAQSGRMGPSSTAQVQGAVDTSTDQLNRSVALQNNSINLQEQQLNTDNQWAVEDINTKTQSAYLSGIGQIAGTLLGSASDIYGYTSSLNTPKTTESSSVSSGQSIDSILGSDYSMSQIQDTTNQFSDLTKNISSSYLSDIFSGASYAAKQSKTTRKLPWESL